VFPVSEWDSSRSEVVRRVQSLFGSTTLIVRSSALAEDTELASLAGAFASVVDVPGGSAEAVEAAIDRVVASYRKGPGATSAGPDNQVLVQPMVTDVSMSGVVFTRELNTGGPYYVINYDDVSGKTDTVTSGREDVSRTLLVHRNHADTLSSARFRRLLSAVREIEQAVPVPALDIEFSETNAGDIYIFQVRPLAIQERWDRDIGADCDRVLREVSSFLEFSLRRQPGLLGVRSIFTEMSDWNPAEMIGPVPRRLAMSLYRLLITDAVWAKARAAMQYRDVGEQPLMVSLGGRVYIDVRKSFNSFLPADLADGIGAKLVDAWLDRLAASPELHDKVEFEVATTVLPLDFDARTRPELLRAGLDAAEVDAFKRSLIALTNHVVAAEPDVVASALGEVERLRQHWDEAAFSNPDFPDRQIPAVVAMLLDDCRQHGTMPFAILARCAFVAEDLLRGLVRLQLLGEAEAAAFRGSVRTVLSDFLIAVHEYSSGKRSRESFCRDYGHLRPGTYDVTSVRIDQREGLWRTGALRAAPADHAGTFELSPAARDAIDAALRARGLSFGAVHLFDFMRRAIVGREYAKLRFTRNLSDALELIARWGLSVGLTREQLSYLDVGDILATRSETADAPHREHFTAIIDRNRARHRVSCAVRLPYLIARSSDIFIVPLLKTRPNFITESTVTGPVVVLTGQEAIEPDLDQKIVLIEGADPGYDWIFARGIRGLITKFGGANSHMAIRCAELKIPAAIGCGEQLFDRIAGCSEVTIDCTSSRVLPAT
jgi:glutamine kinase